jgi:F0F1-type ATP synthase epsilon subunit
MLKVILSTPKELMFDGLAESVYLPGEYGEFEVLPFHQQIMSTLRKGIVRIDEHFFDIKEGIARLDENNELIILVST